MYNTYPPSNLHPSINGHHCPQNICYGCHNAYYPIRVKIPSYRQLWQNWGLSLVFLLILPSLWLILHQYNSSWDALLSTAPVQMSVEASPLGCRKYLKTPLTGMKERIWMLLLKQIMFKFHRSYLSYFFLSLQLISNEQIKKKIVWDKSSCLTQCTTASITFIV